MNNRKLPTLVRVAALVVLGAILLWQWHQNQKQPPNAPLEREETREQPVRQEQKTPDDHAVAGPSINMDHILHGGINRQGNLVGLHHLPSAPEEMSVDGKRCRVEIKQTSPGGPDDVVQAQVKIVDPSTGRVVRQKFSTLYPASWTEKEIVAAIREAYADAEMKYAVADDGKFDGRTRNGIRISGYLLRDGKTINTAFPIYSPTHKGSSRPNSNRIEDRR